MTLAKRSFGWIIGVPILAAIGAALAPGQTTEMVLHNFGRTNGAQPTTTPVLDSAGNLYGTTVEGGPDYVGAIYKLDLAGNYTVLLSFTGGVDGSTQPV